MFGLICVDSPVELCYIGYIMSVLQVLFIMCNIYSFDNMIEWESASFVDRLMIISVFFHYISASCAVLTPFLYSRRLLLDLSAQFYKLYNILMKEDCISFKFFMALIAFHFLLFSHSIHTFITGNIHMAIIEFTYVLVHTAPLAKEIMISIMCYVSEKTYNIIKQKLRILRKMKLNSSSLYNLEQIMDNLEEVQILNEQIKSNFNFDFLTMFFDFIIHSIINAFIFLVILKKSTKYEENNTIAHISNVLVRVIFVAYRSQQVLNEVSYQYLIYLSIFCYLYFICIF